jgi:uncharacterized protein DUF1353
MSGITAAYLDRLRVEQHGNIWRLTHEFRFDSALLGARVIVDAGFLTDFASVPRAPFAYWLTGDYAQGPAVLHDWACTVKLWSWTKAADLFFEAASTDGTALGIPTLPGWRRRAMYAGLRVAGLWRARDYPGES